MKLNAENVHNTFIECLFKDGEDTENRIAVEGIMVKVGFHPKRVKEKEVLIGEMLDELPQEFKASGGGGWSFLNMCNDKDGNQWAGMHQTMEELVMLGIAVGKVSYFMPREFWVSLPGGMPFIIVN